MTVYLDKDCKCHICPGEGLVEAQTDFFDGKCRQFIEGYRYVPEGKSWTREDGRVFSGPMLAPWRDYSLLAELQGLYEETEARAKDQTEALEILEVF